VKSSVKHIELLDYIRGIAIIAVLLFHTLGTAYGYDALPWKGWFRDFSVPVSFLCFLPLSFGQAGVAIFFVVSGFCIHVSFQQQGQRWGDFFIRRFFRIYPPYLAALILFALILPELGRIDFHGQHAWLQLLTHLFLVHNCDPLTFTSINGSFWSLAIEAQLYLLYPVLLVLVARFGRRQTIAILAGCELLIRGLNSVIQMAGATNTTGGHISWLLTNSPLGYWFSWALGAFIAGMLISETEYKHQVETDIRPFHDVLLGLFFITVGAGLDLALVRVHAGGLKAIRWASGEVAIGQWAITPGIAQTPQAVGIISALPHRIRPPRALIGVQFDYSGSKPRIRDILPGLGAEKAGLKSGDVIMAVNAQAVTNRDEVVEALRDFREGQNVKLRIQRLETQFTVELRMMVPRAGQLEGDPSYQRRVSRLGGELSQRSEGFEQAIEHDTVLQPWLCGGPLVDLDGKAIGINIARASRVSTYALPARLVKQILQDLKTKAESHPRL